MSPLNVLDDPEMFLPEVEKRTRRSKVSIWRDEKQGKFPPRHYHGRYAAWFTSQITAYLESLRAKPSGIGPAPMKAIEARRRSASRRRTDQEKTQPSRRRNRLHESGD
jgi:predicted DNA-binding transcriptional regulator AlpA